MRSSTLLAAALATLGAQADHGPYTVVGIFSPDMYPMDVPPQGAGDTSIRATVVDIQSSVSTYEINCQTDTPESACHFANPATAIQGPNTNSFSVEWIAEHTDPSYNVTVTQTWDCSLHSSTGSASCDWSVGYTGTSTGSSASYTSTSSATYASAPIGDLWSNVTVNAGLEMYTQYYTQSTATPTGGAAAPAAAMITAGPILAAAVAALL